MLSSRVNHLSSVLRHFVRLYRPTVVSHFAFSFQPDSLRGDATKEANYSVILSIPCIYKNEFGRREWRKHVIRSNSGAAFLSAPADLPPSIKM